MAQARQSSFPSPEAREAFTVRVLRYLDGELPAEEIQSLRAALFDTAACREWFVHVCRLHGDLYEVYAPDRALRQTKVARATKTAPVSSPAGPAGGEPGVAGRGNGNDAPMLVPPEADPASDGVPDLGADTLHGELTGEDTIHRKPQSPGQ